MALRRIKNPPAVLWCAARDSRPARRLAIVGSRATTEWGRSTASYVAAGAAAHQICVVSGLALGIDIARIVPPLALAVQRLLFSGPV